MKHGYEMIECGLSSAAYETETLHLVVSSDYSLGTNEVIISQLGFIALLVSRTENTCVVSFTSQESKGVVRSVLGAGMFAFADAGDEALLLLHDLCTLYGKDVPLKDLSNSSYLFRIIITSKVTSQPPPMIALNAAREAFDWKDISEIR